MGRPGDADGRDWRGGDGGGALGWGWALLKARVAEDIAGDTYFKQEKTLSKSIT